MQCFEVANQWAMRYEELKLLCRVAGNSGVCAYRQGLYDKGRDYYELVQQYVADQDYRDLPYDIKDIVQYSLTALGLNVAEQWDYLQAEAYYQRAMELARQVNNPERIGYLYLNLGVASFFNSAYDTAQEYFLQAKLIADHIQHDELTTLVTWNQGSLSSAQYKYEIGEKLLKTALSQAWEHGLTWMQPGIYIALGKLYLRQGLAHKANLSFLGALASPGQTGKFKAQAVYGLSLVEVSSNDILGQDKIDKARQCIKEMTTKFAIDQSVIDDLTLQDLQYAHKFFQHDLDGFPQMERFRIVEGLWAGRPTEKT
jgi:tetratricopeptide (TPR) repeat protein